MTDNVNYSTLTIKVDNEVCSSTKINCRKMFAFTRLRGSCTNVFFDFSDCIGWKAALKLTPVIVASERVVKISSFATIFFFWNDLCSFVLLTDWAPSYLLLSEKIWRNAGKQHANQGHVSQADSSLLIHNMSTIIKNVCKMWRMY